MHLDLLEADSDAHRTTEVCIVGCGAAGLTTARRLLELGHTVTLLESGGLDYEADIADLNGGANIGHDYYQLQESRLRFFGGTTAIWGGRLAELDAVDLQRREWVPHSGWPISWDELQAYYGKARRLFGLSPEAARAGHLLKAKVPLPTFAADTLEVGVWSFDRKFNRFVFDSCRDLVEHPRCTVITHATVTELKLAPGQERIAYIDAGALSGRRLRIGAQAYVLAAGGLENPRLLLASRSVAPSGVGNQLDQVGRYFMEHPHARGGRVLGPGAWALLRAFGRSHRVTGGELAALIKPSAAMQAELGILNSSLTIAARPPVDGSRFWAASAYAKLKHNVAPTRKGRAVWMMTKTASKWVQARTDPLRPWLLHRAGLRDVALVLRAEQAPNPRSRVVLTDQLDPMGVPRLALDWRLTDLDVRSVSSLVDALHAALGSLNLGSVEKAAWLREAEPTWQSDPLISQHAIGGYHHMGTTRMSEHPRDGVTDSAGKVHGVDNLHVVGSSVFSTAGWANPTLTIAALALRTGEEISSRLASCRAA